MNSTLSKVGLVVIFLMALAIFALPAISGGFESSGNSLVLHNTPKGVVSVQHGYRGSRVGYVAFSFDGTDEPPELVTTRNSSTSPVDLVVPGQAPRPFPLESNVFEWIDGKFAEKQLHLDREAVREFCSDHRQDFSIAGLEGFLAAR